MRTLILDNYDSFTFNLYQEAGVLGGNPVVIRNDKISIAEVRAGGFSHLIVSPGPGNPDTPRDIGISKELVAFALTEKIPLLGVCLGHQIIGKHFDATVKRAAEARHGKTSLVRFTGERSRIFAGLPEAIEVMRYHSLCVENLPKCLRQTAMTDDGVLMGMEHTDAPIFGVQFHPESIGTPDGSAILRNFLNIS